MNALHCLESAPEGSKELDFYRWIMFTGLQCGDCGAGCLPVNEDGERRTSGYAARVFVYSCLG